MTRSLRRWLVPAGLALGLGLVPAAPPAPGNPFGPCGYADATVVAGLGLRLPLGFYCDEPCIGVEHGPSSAHLGDTRVEAYACAHIF
jgi:hypothetical protein